MTQARKDPPPHPGRRVTERIGGALYTTGYAGLGDTIYMRPLILNQFRWYDEVYVRTPWPELYRGTDVRPVYYGGLTLRTQCLSMDAWDGRWYDAPDVKPRAIRYQLYHPDQNIVTDLERSFRYDGRYGMALPSFVDDAPDLGTTRPVAVVRVNTVRKEWRTPARNCGPSYMAEAAELLSELGYYVVTVASTEPNREWVDGDAVPADRDFTRGELSTAQLCGLVESADLVVGSPGFILPMSMAYRTPMVCVLGGLLRFNTPERLTDPRMGANVQWVMPDNPCHCTQRMHECDKTVTGFRAQFVGAVAGLGFPELVSVA